MRSEERFPEWKTARKIWTDERAFRNVLLMCCVRLILLASTKILPRGEKRNLLPVDIWCKQMGNVLLHHRFEVQVIFWSSNLLSSSSAEKLALIHVFYCILIADFDLDRKKLRVFVVLPDVINGTKNGKAGSSWWCFERVCYTEEKVFKY